jgi:hypothetical protein
MSEKLKEAKNLVDAYLTYYNLSELAGGWTAGASWTDPDGKVHELTTGADLEYKFKKSKLLYAINYRSTGYRSRRLVYLTDRIHADTLNGKGHYGYYYGNSSSRKNGKISFFRCDVKGEETAKKIVTKYCNQNDCYAYLMIDSEHPEDSTDGFDDLVSHIGGESRLLNVSDYRDLLKNTGQSRNSVGSLGSVSSQDIFLIHGNISSAKSIDSENQMNDAQHLLEITDQDDRDAILDQDEIVYVPILRYASVGGYPNIHNISRLIEDDSAKFIVKNVFGDTNVFAIKQSYANQLIKQGYNLVSFNDFFKKGVQKLYKDKLEKLSQYNGLIEYAKHEYEKDESTSNNHYYRAATTDKSFLWSILNVFGLDYNKHIKNKEIVSLIDQCICMEFFAHTIRLNQFDIKKLSSKDYFAKVTQILSDIGLNGIDSNEIRSANVTLNNLVAYIKSLYPEDKDMVKIVRSESSLKDKLPKIDVLRKNIKDELDKQPMLKYIVGSVETTGNLRELNDENPIKNLGSNNYYSRKSGWIVKLDGDSLEKLRESIGSTIV